MRKLDHLFLNRTINSKKLLEYGFIKNKDEFIYKEKILDDLFELRMYINDKEKTSKIIDLEADEEYILCDIDISGDFVGKVNCEYDRVIEDIINKCTTLNIFKSSQTKRVIQYLKEKYNDELEFLWEKTPNNAVFRNKTNKKWYGAILTITEDKLGLSSNKEIEIIDLRYDKEKIDELVDNKIVYPGYHMNKKSWITIKLDYSVSDDDLFNLIDNSYNLSSKK